MLYREGGSHVPGHLRPHIEVRHGRPGLYRLGILNPANHILRMVRELPCDVGAIGESGEVT